MPLFAEKALCPSCEQKVKKPKDPGDYLCPHCGHPGPWASPNQRSAWEAEAAARARYDDLLSQITSGSRALAHGSELANVRAATGYTSGELVGLHLDAIRSVVLAAVADDLLTPDERSNLTAVTSALGLTWQQVADSDPALYERVFVSSINGGDLPEVASPHILPKKGEIVHYECLATLMKEVAVRQYQGGYSGFSFPIGKSGVRYRVGGTRGHSVQVGTQLKVADTGLLSVTNKRCVYAGTSKTVEMLYTKLVNLTVYSDGLQFHLSNRVNAPLFKIPQGTHIIAAIVNAAAQRRNEL
jgi:hypothetical protein